MGRIRHFYRLFDSTSQYGIIKLTMFQSGPGGYPRLKGKAAEIRHVLKPIMNVWEESCDPANVDHATVLLALQTSARMDEILDEYPSANVFPPAIGEEFFQNCVLHCQCQTKLSNYMDIKSFNVTQKLHFLCHAGFRGKHMNPRKSWCFRGESFMMKIRKIGSACARGNDPMQSSGKIAEKLQVAMHLTFTGHARF